MKKKLAYIILVALCLSTYAEDFSVLNGLWKDQSFYDYVTTNLASYGDEGRSYKNKQAGMEIEIKPDGTGSFWYGNSFGITQVEQMGDTEFTLYLVGFTYVYKYDSELDLYFYDTADGSPSGEIVITVIDEDSISANFGRFGQTDKEEHWIRVSGPAKIPEQYGVMNDTRVRLRTKPNLESDTWAFLHTGDEVIIIDKSAEMQKIGDMEDYWYKVQTELFPDGWVYGAFIDIED